MDLKKLTELTVEDIELSGDLGLQLKKRYSVVGYKKMRELAEQHIELTAEEIEVLFHNIKVMKHDIELMRQQIKVNKKEIYLKKEKIASKNK